MEKIRVYELAKDLNTTSKRLMEKLAEINISVKNHMSLLEEHELEALYKHIGVIRHDEEKKAESDEKKVTAPVQPRPEPKKEIKKETKKEAKSMPRIIRTTEINLDSKNTDSSRGQGFRRDNDRSGRKDFGHKRDFVRVADANSGLRAGFVRDSGPDYTREIREYNKQTAGRKQQEAKEASRTEDAKKQVAPDAKLQARPEKTADMTPASQELRSESAELAKQAEKPEMAVRAESGENVMDTVKNEKIAQVDGTKPVSPIAADRAADKVEKAEKADNKAERGGKADGIDKARKSGDDRAEKGEAAVKADMPEEARKAGDAAGLQAGAARESTRGKGPRMDSDTRPPRQKDMRSGAKSPEGREAQPQFRDRDRKNSGDRPGGGYGDRPRSGGSGDRPGGGYGDRPRSGGSGDRPGGGYGDRPRSGGSGDRPGGGYGDRPRSGGSGDRPGGGYGDRSRSEGFGRTGPKTGDRRAQPSRPGQRPLEIPKPELSLAQKEEAASQRGEVRREFQSKDVQKDVKREQKREVAKTQAPGKSKKFKPQTIVLSEKKGITEVLSEDFIFNEFYSDSNALKASRKPSRGKKDGRGGQQVKQAPHKAVLTSITIPETITVKDLAESLKKTATDVIKKLMNLGLMVTLNQEIDFETAGIVADEYGVKVEKEVVVNEEDILFDDTEEDESKLKPRPPVVVVMGHVDHGKTSLLDAIKKTNVIESEAGGITQHIGAYTVKINNRNITFLDTPGHEAFTAMRARGAQVTDIAILVVAADDGVMPQTVEAINHAKAANVSIIVAVNKIDKPDANPDRIKQQLTEYGLVVEEWGGDVICVPVSAKKGENIDQLLEMVLLTADMLELKANPHKQAKGTIIEAKLDKNRGPLATLLVQRGTLNVGDSIVTGTTFGRIRAMTDDKGNSIKEAGPSTPVEILGMPEVPEAGEIFYAVTDEKIARQLAEKRKQKQREEHLKSSARVSLEDLFSQIKEGKVKDLNIIVKADVQGSVEAVKQSLEKLNNEEVRINIIHGGVGAVTESDVTLAEVSNAIIIGFNVRPGVNVAEVAEAAGVDLRLYRIIYDAIEDVQAAMNGMLEPTFKEVVLGHTEIRQLFKVSGIGTIAGCYVTDGKIIRNADVRIVRNGIVIHEGKLASLKRFKDDAKEVAQGFECGLSIEKFNDLKEGDIVEAYTMEEVAR